MSVWQAIGIFCLIVFVFWAWDGISSMPGDPEREQERRERERK